MRHKILLVDDEAENRAFLKGVLEAHGFGVLLAAEAREALLAATDSRPDLVLSDVSLPGMSGLELCRALKGAPATAAMPVILMSGVRRQEGEQAEGIDLGADDYLVKPFAPRLLLSKIRGVLRRCEPPAELEETLRADGLTLDLQARTVCGARGRIALTRKEFDLLTLFIRKPGRVLNVPYLLETVWGYDPAAYNDPHTVQSHMATLRRKVGPRLARRLVSVRGLGYRFDPPGKGI